MNIAEGMVELVRDFIADEEAAIASGRQGQVWPSQHHRLPSHLGGVMPLSDDERIKFYHHLVRMSGRVPPVAQREFPFLLAGYRRLLQNPATYSLARRHELLFLFGFDQAHSLSHGPTETAKALKLLNTLCMQSHKFSSLTGQLDKPAVFVAHAHYAPRILETFRCIGYQQDARARDGNAIIPDLGFWGMMLAGLLNTDARSMLLGDVWGGEYSLPDRDRFLANMRCYVNVARSQVASEQPEFDRMAEQINEYYQGRRNASESAIWAKSLELEIDHQADWNIIIIIPGARTAAHLPPSITLTIRNSPDMPWQLRLRDGERRTFSEWHGEISQNDLALPGLGAGNLTRFPQWLKAVSESTGIAFAPARADITCGRYRSAAKRLMEWMLAEQSHI